MPPPRRRIWQRYQADGDAGLVHRRRGQASARRKPATLRAQALALYAQERCADFGPPLMAEQLAQAKLVDHETLRRWRMAAGQHMVRRRKQAHRQFGRAAASPLAVHRAVPQNLAEVLSWEEARGGAGGLDGDVRRAAHQLDRQPAAMSLVRRKVIVRRLRRRRVQLMHRGQALHWRLCQAASAAGPTLFIRPASSSEGQAMSSRSSAAGWWRAGWSR